jgi:hypothetical protein
LKILFDQNAPRPLARYLTNHVVTCAAELGWEQLTNGDLLKGAEETGFDVLAWSSCLPVAGRSCGRVFLSSYRLWIGRARKLLQADRAAAEALRISETIASEARPFREGQRFQWFCVW